MAKTKVEGKMTKAAAVREALKAGVENPTEGAAFVKEKFGLDVTPNQFSIYKSQEKKKGGKVKGKRGRKPGSKNAPAGNFVGNGRKTRRLNAVDGNNGVALAKGVKSLVDAYGSAAVKEMTDVFAD